MRLQTKERDRLHSLDTMVADMATFVPMSQITLTEWRTEARKSLAETAGLLGIGGTNAARTLQRYESGERPCPLELALAIESLTGGRVPPVSFQRAREEFTMSRPTPAAFASASGHVVTPHQPQGSAGVVGGEAGLACPASDPSTGSGGPKLKGGADNLHDGENAADGRAAHVNSSDDASQAVAR